MGPAPPVRRERSLCLKADGVMQKYGRGFMLAAAWMAAIGLFLSEPAGDVPQPYHLFNFLVHGFEIRLFQDAEQPAEFAVHLPSIDWLLFCIAVFLFGALLAAIAFFWHTRDADRPPA